MEAEKSESLVELFSKGLVLLGPVCIGFSIFYDWGYLYGLGLSFREVPTTITDHVRSAIFWLPYGVLFSAFIIPLGMYFARKDAASNTDPVFWEKKERLENFIWTINGLILIGSWVLWGDKLIGLAAFGVGQILLTIAFLSLRKKSKKQRLIYILSGFSFLCASILFAMGSFGASSKLNLAPEDDLLLKAGEANEVVRGAILRRFEQSVIIMNDKHVIIILKPEDLLRVTIGLEKRGYRGGNV